MSNIQSTKFVRNLDIFKENSHLTELYQEKCYWGTIKPIFSQNVFKLVTFLSWIKVGPNSTNMGKIGLYLKKT